MAAFRGGLFFCSNMFTCRIEGEDGHMYGSGEHAYVACKVLSEHRDKIRLASTPQKAKRLGRKLPIRKDWDLIKLQVMERILRKKFSCELLAKMLTDTGEQPLVEYNEWHDNFWGDCTCQRCDIIKGENNLGKLLMKIRSELRQ